MNEDLLNKVRRLRQSDETWLCTARRAPTWIMPDDQPPYRPYVVLVVVQESELIRRTGIRDKRPGPDIVLEELLNAMRPSLPRMLVGFGRRRRPARILLDDADLVQALTPRLAEIGVRCEYRARLPLVDATLREMEAHMNKKHVDNCWLIGTFVCSYGYYDEFSPEIFAGEPSYLHEFKRKVSDSKSAVASYKATWRKLVRYVGSLGYGD